MASIRVLLVEDNPGDARLVQVALQGAEGGAFTLAHAGTLAAGVRRLVGGEIDVVLSDLGLPDSDGLEAIDRLKAAGPGIPILVLTGSYDEARGVEAVRRGAQDYIPKDEMAARPLIRAIRYALERKRVSEELARANRDLEAARGALESRVEERTKELALANRDLETMLHVATHDLKEPLSSIRAFSDLLSETAGGRLDEKEKDHLRRIVRSVDRMRRLLDDLLVLTRAQKIEIPETPVSAAEAAKEAMARLAERIRDTGAKIRIGESLPAIRLHPAWAVVVVQNLLSNALKFTRPGAPPEVEIDAYRGPEGIGISVRDRGPGVPPDLAEKIFQLFQRGVGREVEGTGAGLAIVRQVAERHGGRAWVRARAPREDGVGGAEFIVTIEKEAPARALDLLLVDDDDDFLFLLEETFTEAGVTSHIGKARDGVEALSYLKHTNGHKDATRPDAVLLDLNMPRKNGFEVLEEMRKDPELAGIPVLVVTASARREDKERAKAGGAREYVTKPFGFDQIIATVRRIVSE